MAAFEWLLVCDSKRNYVPQLINFCIQLCSIDYSFCITTNTNVSVVFHCCSAIPPLRLLSDAVMMGVKLSAVACLMQVGHSAFSGKSRVTYLIDCVHDTICITQAVIFMSWL